MYPKDFIDYDFVAKDEHSKVEMALYREPHGPHGPII